MSFIIVDMTRKHPLSSIGSSPHRERFLAEMNQLIS